MSVPSTLQGTHEGCGGAVRFRIDSQRDALLAGRLVLLEGACGACGAELTTRWSLPQELRDDVTLQMAAGGESLRHRPEPMLPSSREWKPRSLSLASEPPSDLRGEPSRFVASRPSLRDVATRDPWRLAAEAEASPTPRRLEPLEPPRGLVADRRATEPLPTSRPLRLDPEASAPTETRPERRRVERPSLSQRPVRDRETGDPELQEYLSRLDTKVRSTLSNLDRITDSLPSAFDVLREETAFRSPNLFRRTVDRSQEPATEPAPAHEPARVQAPEVSPFVEHVEQPTATHEPLPVAPSLAPTELPPLAPAAAGAQAPTAPAATTVDPAIGIASTDADVFPPAPQELVTPDAVPAAQAVVQAVPAPAPEPAPVQAHAPQPTAVAPAATSADIWDAPHDPTQVPEHAIQVEQVAAPAAGASFADAYGQAAEDVAAMVSAPTQPQVVQTPEQLHVDPSVAFDPDRGFDWGPDDDAAAVPSRGRSLRARIGSRTRVKSASMPSIGQAPKELVFERAGGSTATAPRRRFGIVTVTAIAFLLVTAALAGMKIVTTDDVPAGRAQDASANADDPKLTKIPKPLDVEPAASSGDATTVADSTSSSDTAAQALPETAEPSATHGVTVAGDEALAAAVAATNALDPASTQVPDTDADTTGETP